MKWLPEEDALLRELHPHYPNGWIAEALGRSEASIQNRVFTLRLKKSAEYLEVASGRFVKGHESPNKGKKLGAAWCKGRMRETQFKKGHRPHMWLPVGTERLMKGGYVEVKVRDTGKRKCDNWVSKQRLVWEQAHGPVPKGSVVIFKNGDRRDFRLENLECVTRRELWNRNSSHRWGKEVFELIQLRGALNRQIRRRLGKRD